MIIPPVYIKDVPSKVELLQSETARHAHGYAEYKLKADISEAITEALQVFHLDLPVMSQEEFLAFWANNKEHYAF